MTERHLERVGAVQTINSDWAPIGKEANLVPKSSRKITADAEAFSVQISFFQIAFWDLFIFKGNSIFS